jgi:hypothetical protein
MGGDEAILIEHSYLNVSESVTAVYIPYIAAHVFQLKVPGCTGGTPGGRLAPPAAVFRVRAAESAVVRSRAAAGQRRARGPDFRFLPAAGWRRAGRAGA